MDDLNLYRIPVVPGVNDEPIEPDFENNNRGCNGAYFIQKYHGLLSYLEQNLSALAPSQPANAIHYELLEGDLLLTADSLPVQHLDPNGMSREVRLDPNVSFEYKILNLDGNHPLYLYDGADLAAELSFQSNCIEATVGYSGGILRISLAPGTLIING